MQFPFTIFVRWAIVLINRKLVPFKEIQAGKHFGVERSNCALDVCYLLSGNFAS